MTSIIEHDNEFRSARSSESRVALCADDDTTTRALLRAVLGKAGYQVILAEDGAQAMEAMHEGVDVALLDMHMPRASGLECLVHIKKHFPETQVVMVSALGEVSDVAQVMKAGAFWFLKKPLDMEELLANLSKAYEVRMLARRNQDLLSVVGEAALPAHIVGEAKASQKLMQQVLQVAASDATVLITGESGTGKTTIARYLHQASSRSAAPFVSVSCAALPRDLLEAELFGHERGAFTGAVHARPGRVEVADGGTVFLDEIGDIPLELQPKLLTFLQDKTVQRIGSVKEKKVDVRLIAATLQDLHEMCGRRVFREDLYFRLNVLNIHVPPLRERIDDIPLFVRGILGKINARSKDREVRISSEALMALMQYEWPGNIRELENVLERASAFCQEKFIRPEDLKFMPAIGRQREAVRELSLAGMPLDQVEALAITETLKLCLGNKAAAARKLQISEKSIYNKMRRLGLRAS